MEKVLVDIGEMVEVDENVEDRRRMDVARILIWTKLRPAIQERYRPSSMELNTLSTLWRTRSEWVRR